MIVQRAGDVIPQVVGPVIPPPRARRVPEPSAAPLRHRDGQARGRGRCTAAPTGLPVPRPRDADRLGRGAMDIEGVGELDARLWTGPRQLDARPLPPHGGAAARARRLRRDLGANAVEAIQRPGTPFSGELFGLNISKIGSVMAQSLARHFGDVERMIDATQEEIEEVEGFGPGPRRGDRRVVRRRGIWLSVAGLRATWLLRGGRGGRAGPGRFTGPPTWSPERSRLDARGHGGARGAAPRSRTRSRARTTAVIAGESPGSKLQKAQKAGVEVLDEPGLVKLLRGGG